MIRITPVVKHLELVEEEVNDVVLSRSPLRFFARSRPTEQRCEIFSGERSDSSLESVFQAGERDSSRASRCTASNIFPSRCRRFASIRRENTFLFTYWRGYSANGGDRFVYSQLEDEREGPECSASHSVRTGELWRNSKDTNNAV